MATQAHCAYCFETLSAHFDQRKPLSLRQVEELWEKYRSGTKQQADAHAGASAGGLDHEDGVDDAEMTDVETESDDTPKPAAISRLLNRKADSSAGSSSSSLPSSKSSASNQASGSATPASSISSNSSLLLGMNKSGRYEDFPLFVTWNTHSPRSGNKSLRGCIGTFEAQELEHGLRSYALTSALEDVRFSPIPPSLLPQLSAHVTLLTNFSSPTRDPLDWTLGTHGIRISFSVGGRRYGSTYLPDVAKEQGWTKEETMVSLMRKGGWNGSSSQWAKVWKDGRGELVRYEGKIVGLNYREWQDWKDWVEETTQKSR